jgi:cytoskeleton protein RodZ
MAAEAAGDGRTGIGIRLRSAREQKGLTILQAAEKLHVDPKILELLESEDFAPLGAPVYARGHLRHYAELVGESASQLQELYSNSIKVAPPDLTRIPKAQPQSNPGNLVVPALCLLIAFALAGSVWWLVKLPAGSGGPQPVPVSASIRDTSEPTSTQASAPVDVASSSGGVQTSPPARGASSGAGVATRSGTTVGAPATRPGATTAGVSTTRAGAAQLPVAGVAGQGAASAQPGAAVSPGTKRQAELTLKFTSDSWAEVYDATGQRLFFDVGPASSVHTLKGPAPLRVVLGNAPGVTVEVNGHPTGIAKLMRPDGSAQFLINAAGRAVNAKPAADGE